MTSGDDAPVIKFKKEPAEWILNARLRNARQQCGQLQAELAQKADIAASTLSHFEAGRRVPNLKQLIRLANALNVSIDYLLGRTDDALSHFSLKSEFGRSKMSLQDLNLLRAIADRLAAAPMSAAVGRFQIREEREGEEREAAAPEAPSLDDETPKER